MKKSSDLYPKKPHEIGAAGSVTMTNRSKDKVIPVRHNTPGNIILIHGVNDVGNSYAAVERGLCEGLSTRLSGELNPAQYKLPDDQDRKSVLHNPDAVFFKRSITDKTLSPVIPFYWGFREIDEKVQLKSELSRGQMLDRNGNRLDMDFSKGGGPFANATSTLPDMWNRGKWGVGGLLDRFQNDATHPIRNNPGRLYMILAAQRLAALICMIRDYDPDETVSVVAHSQGCLITLLAQAFLIDPKMKKDQPNARPADTLILTHPPYSLIDEIPKYTVKPIDLYSDTDKSMENGYEKINGAQTTDARIKTLANIVNGVTREKHTSPPIQELSDASKHYGAVGKKWVPSEDRDNRGKVYLYFCPEDMTVALEGVRGIGWQGVPTLQRALATNGRKDITYSPLNMLGEGFKQRVFTAKKRPDPQSGKPVMVGPKDSPFQFLLRTPKENDYEHTSVSDSYLSKNFVRGQLDTPSGRKLGVDDAEAANQGVRNINGESLKIPVQASMFEGSLNDAQGRRGASEMVDPIDAAIALTSDSGLNEVWEVVDYPTISNALSDREVLFSPQGSVFSGHVVEAGFLKVAVQKFINKNKLEEEGFEVLEVFACSSSREEFVATYPNKILIKRYESWNAARLRWQKTIVPRSFHGAIFGGQDNHKNVTAYDVAIGGGKASSDPEFYRYLCCIGDWRLQKSSQLYRLGVNKWSDFKDRFSGYLSVEPKWRSKLIESSSIYYSTGILPVNLPVLPDGLPNSVVCELKK